MITGHPARIENKMEGDDLKYDEVSEEPE